MRRVSETNIFRRNNNCTTALSTARCYFETTDDFPIFLSSRRLSLKISTEIKQEDIIQSLMTRKIVIFQEISSMHFRLCEIQLGAQCLLGEHGPLKQFETNPYSDCFFPEKFIVKLSCCYVCSSSWLWYTV